MEEDDSSYELKVVVQGGEEEEQEDEDEDEEEEEEEEEERSLGERLDRAEDDANCGSDRCDGVIQDEDKDSEDDDEWFYYLMLMRDAAKVDDGSKKGLEESPEELILKTVQTKRYHKVRGRITAKALMNYSENPLLLSIKVAEELRNREEKNKPDKYDFGNLASRVEEFTLRFLDPLKYEEDLRETFFGRPETDVILETATKLKQKKFFDHPVIIDLLDHRWRGGDQYREWSRRWWFFLTVWSLFDCVLFPALFALAYITGKYKDYKTYFRIPYFIFVRDMISYLVLLALHLALCVEASQLAFSGLEWAILCFFVGRLLNEIKQLKDVRKHSKASAKKRTALYVTVNYFRDLWNVLDVIIVAFFVFVILPLRIFTWAGSESVTNNRALAIASYVYGINTMLLTFRVFGVILETFEGVGTIQIAFYHVISDAVTVVLHLLIITLAFTSAITKIFVAEKSMVKKDIMGKQPACNETGIECWYMIVRHLAWSLLQLSKGLSSLESTDSFSEYLVVLLFAAFLVLVAILLINMLIALLSNTYQRVQDNSRKEWVFYRALTIETYRNYSLIPVPMNIISFLPELIRSVRKKRKIGVQEQESQVVKELLDKYRLKYGDSFPPTNKLDQVLDDSENTESMVNQVLYRAFTSQQGPDKALLPTGQKAWKTHDAILVEGYLITRQPYVKKMSRCGARYTKEFSSMFPHFEVMILESGETRWLGLGVVFEDYGTDSMPGWFNGTVGYHTDDRTIFDSAHNESGKKTIGSTAARRGDVIRCTVMFEDAQEIDGKMQVSVVFSVNGSIIKPEDEKPSYIEYSTSRPLFPYLAFQYGNSVLAKMCAREDIDLQGQEMKSNLAEVKDKLECMQKKLDVLLAKLSENE